MRNVEARRGAAATPKVHVYVHDLRSSGVVRNALAIAARLAQDRPTTLIAGFRDGFFLDQAERGPFAFEALNDGPARGAASRFAAAWRLRKRLGSGDAILLSAGNFGHPTVWAATRGLARVQRLYLMSNEIGRAGRASNGPREWWAEALVKDAAKLMIVSPTVAASPSLAAALQSGKALLIPNGVDVGAARDARRGPPPHLWLEEDVPVVVGVGRLRPQKNFPMLIEAMARARIQRRIRLLILGGGSAEAAAELQGCAEAAGLGEDFELAGETDNVFAWLGPASLFAMSSRYEGSSVALLEALAAGTPVVATRQAGDAAQVLGDGRYGLLADVDDVAGFAEAILKQLSGYRVLPGQRAQDYSIDAMLEAYAQLIGSLALPGAAQPATGTLQPRHA